MLMSSAAEAVMRPYLTGICMWRKVRQNTSYNSAIAF